MPKGIVLPSILILSLLSLPSAAAPLPQVHDVEVQPLMVQVKRLQEALDYLGAPLSDEAKASLAKAAETTDDREAKRLVQETLDPLCLAMVKISPESRVKLAPGPAAPLLDEQGWRLFLIKVHNLAGVTAPLRCQSEQAKPLAESSAAELRDRWLEIQMFDRRPLAKGLSGLQLEYRPILFYSRDAGRRSAVLAMDVGQGTQDSGFRNDVVVNFICRPSKPLKFIIRDENGKATTAGIEVRDARGRVYPSQSKRLAPDFFFHPQVYRSSGESIRLPAGEYSIKVTRGPEYHAVQRNVTVTGEGQTVEFDLKRWVDPSLLGWWSGDHHIHAAGCSHYKNPTEGVLPIDMMRHCLGEDLKIGANLTWGPCFDYQKQFFTGKVDKVSQYPYLLRYDVEVSGFGSHQSGHLCLLRLKEQIHPGGDSKHHWPTLCLNTLRWAKKQGAVCGPAHSGWGLEVNTDKLPNYTVPPFNSIGANEYIVDVTHDVEGPDGKPTPAVDFLSMCDTPYVWELNIWYHTLNCGFRTRVSGETDFPCIYGERVGMGRAYVKLDGRLDYDQWCEGITKGACYVSDGRSHLMDLTVNDVALGTKGSEVRLDQPGSVHVTAKVAAFLPEERNAKIQNASYKNKPYWHIERARLGETREVNVELLVNGYPVESQRLLADGNTQDLLFETKIERSSWVALRILGTSHTNPMFVLVDDEPIRASRRSAKWCLDGVEQCWKQKERFIAKDELPGARDDYDHARGVYAKIIEESHDDQ